MKIINHVIWSLRDLLSLWLLYLNSESHRKTFLFLSAWISNSLCREGKVPFLNSFQTYVQLTWVLRENLELEGPSTHSTSSKSHSNAPQKQTSNACKTSTIKLKTCSWKNRVEWNFKVDWVRLRGFNKGNFINLFSRNKEGRTKVLRQFCGHHPFKFRFYN